MNKKQGSVNLLMAITTAMTSVALSSSIGFSNRLQAVSANEPTRLIPESVQEEILENIEDHMSFVTGEYRVKGIYRLWQH